MTLQGRRIAIYARFSSALQNDTSVDDQVHRCIRFIQEEGGTHNPSLVFEDRATSGASLQRPGFEQLMQKAKNQEVDVIVVEDMSRVSGEWLTRPPCIANSTGLACGWSASQTESTPRTEEQS